MPRGSTRKAWPDWPLLHLDEGERTPRQLLKAVLRLAGSDPSALAVMSELVPRCMENAHETPIDDADHAEFVRRAHEAALAGQWDSARRLLDHTMEESQMPTPWPRYPQNDPAWDKLREIVVLAHLGCPPNLIAPLIALAFKCAANAHATEPHQQGVTPAQDAHVTAALTYARAAVTPLEWQAVYDELNHD